MCCGRKVALAALLSSSGVLAGCETLQPLTLGLGVVSYVATGKGLTDHALGAVTEKDCNILQGLLSAERRICEPRDSRLAGRSDSPGPLARGEDRARDAAARPSPALRLAESLVARSPASSAASLATSVTAPDLRFSPDLGRAPGAANANERSQLASL